ncbi:MULTISPECIES: alpha/beta fold hydrolase [unclassified Rhodococcus (in: high G+C Gram-positive bacteria)]|uniref:alpha/beta fold hydrolase n=1 Tax=unclassified Rhodococcus (in: high G+C Gram-positive bacteria) TaxID=192944 RepID=UPI00163A695A|nr:MULTISPECIES: alpha/beta hydrolase [unclassified Rhodococcus (in: high G+C Gram-positive bacteria)]MBC2641768.1 alpha/beta hydrolase [Rhodococcus sp. 3A]MBC2893487.1 alpha/beta hydrolase [Rhodococcus sp. 4CII]
MVDPNRVGEPAQQEFAHRWGGVGRVVDLDGPVHWVEYGEDTGATPVVMVHGLGGSHLNWVRIAPVLAKRTRVLTVDLPGFGLSPSGRRRTGVGANATVLHRFLREVVGRPVILMGNSMGGMISLFEAAAHPETVSALILVDPALPVAQRVPDPRIAVQFAMYFTPFVGERYLQYAGRKMTDRQLVERMIDLCFADPSRASEDSLDAAAALTGYRRGLPSEDAAFLQASRSLMRVLARPRRYLGVMQSITQPVLLLHGDRDRLVPVAAARKVATANPRWDSVILADVGHTPQLEVPDALLDRVQTWVDRHGLIDV